MVSILRAATDADHRAVDDRFGLFDLADARDYGTFLQAHARVLPAFEASLAEACILPPWPRRAGLLAQDLTALGLAQPQPIEADRPCSAAAAFGMQYVVQGSRLGGRLLARRVGDGLPRAYLSAALEPGEWRAFLERLEEVVEDPTARAEAIAAAKRTFAAYHAAVHVLPRAAEAAAGA